MSKSFEMTAQGRYHARFLESAPELIADISHSYDKQWQLRKRVIDSHFLVLFIFKLVLSKNHQGYKSILRELWESPELSNSHHRPVSSSSVCEARQKLPEQIFMEINKDILSEREKTTALPRWRAIEFLR